jgi:hypothetical protein
MKMVSNSGVARNFFVGADFKFLINITHDCCNKSREVKGLKKRNFGLVKILRISRIFFGWVNLNISPQPLSLL